MSTSDGIGTTGTDSSSGEGPPAASYKRRKITALGQPTADPLFEVSGKAARIGDDEDGRFDKLKEEDTRWLTDNSKFFPELAWRKVAEKLKSKADIERCSNASPFFGDLLREKRERELVLPTVFGILSKRYANVANKDESYKETNLESIPWRRGPQSGEEPHRMSGLWKCRLVSKKWNKAIEKIHQNEDAGHFKMRILHDLDTPENNHLSDKWATYNFRRESEVGKFLGHFEETHYDGIRQVSKKCPFLGRSVDVSMSFVENNQAYLDRLSEMFEKFGDQVWYLELFWRFSAGDNHVNAYRLVKQFVELIPELKVLRINLYGFPLSEPQLMIQPLEEETERNPFPKRTQLEMVSFVRIPGVVRTHLVHQNPQISRVEIANTDFNGNSPLFIDNLPNLKHLSLWDMDSRVILDALELYPFTLNVEKFTFQCGPSFQFVRWSRMFNTIGSKLNPDSCTDLQILMANPRSNAEKTSVLQDSLLCRLNLRNIQRCQICSCARFSLDFLLSSKNSLREIEIRGDLKGRDAERDKFVDRQVIKFLGIEEKMEQSNIGNELPRLRKLVTCSDIGVHALARHYYIEPNGIVRVK